jgi:hypothetical protein
MAFLESDLLLSDTVKFQASMLMQLFAPLIKHVSFRIMMIDKLVKVF